MLSHFRPQDIADILIMAFLVYQLYSWFKNTKALQVMIGVLCLGILYFVTKNLGLYMTSWILQELGTVLFVLLIVVFQSEIRQALYRFSPLRNFFGRQSNGLREDLQPLTDTVFSLAAECTGALIAFQREEPLDEYLLHGVPLDSLVSGELLTSIFSTESPLHDGAVLIRDGRLAVASCHLPLSVNADIPQYYGTRHRAGLGLSERSDAVVLMVSEERGEVTLALAGALEPVATSGDLHQRLSALLSPLSQEAHRVTLRERIFKNFWQKATVVLLVFAVWLLLTFRQEEIVTVTAPVKFHSLPDTLTLTRANPDQVDLQIKAFSNLISPKQLDVSIDLDLSRAHEGSNSVPIRREDIKLPPGIAVAGMERSQVRVTVEKRQRRAAPR